MLREVDLPEVVKGRLLLRRMPGYEESYPEAEQELREARPDRLVCLAPRSELKVKSPSYHEAIASRRLPFRLEMFPIEDYSTPPDRRSFLLFVHEVAAGLIAGETILAHCAAGVGRSGMLAQAVLHSLGIERTDAAARVHAAGGRTESAEQMGLLAWVRTMKSVYVIELDRHVLSIPRFVETSPGFRKDLEPLYVGMTNLAPAMRFLNHKRGHKAARYVRQHGLRLRPDLYRECNPFLQEDVERAEIELAEELRELGHAVRQN